MKLFIFGAGASRGSQGSTSITSKRAPLMNDLLNADAIKFANEIGLSISDLIYRFNELDFQKTSFEKELTVYWDAAVTKKLRTERIIHARYVELGNFTHFIRYWLQSVSEYSGEDIYKKLLLKLRDEEGSEGTEIAYINFNYDTLLDRAMKSVFSGAHLSSLVDYFAARFYKPHGSINWWARRRIDDESVQVLSNDDIKMNFQVAARNLLKESSLKIDNFMFFEPDYQHLNNFHALTVKHFDNQYGHPLIFLPVTTKQFPHLQEMSDLINNELTKILNDITEIYMIGYQASDEIIKTYLQLIQHPIKIHIVTNEYQGGIYISEKLKTLKKDVKIVIHYDNINVKEKNGFKVFCDKYPNI